MHCPTETTARCARETIVDLAKSAFIFITYLFGNIAAAKTSHKSGFFFFHGSGADGGRIVRLEDPVRNGQKNAADHHNDGTDADSARTIHPRSQIRDRKDHQQITDLETRRDQTSFCGGNLREERGRRWEGRREV